MDRRSLLAIALSFLVLVAWYSWFSPAPTLKPPAAEEGASVKPPAAEVPEATPKAIPGDVPPADAPTAEAIAAAGEEEVRVETDLFQVVLTNRGARATSWQLKDYASGAKPVELIPAFARAEHRGGLVLEIPGDEALTREIQGALFRVERQTLDAPTRGERIHFVWADGRGRRVEKTLTFQKNSYLVDLSIAVSDRGKAVPARVAWGPGLEADDSIQGGYLHYTGQAVVRNAGAVMRFPRQKTSAESVVAPSEQLEWSGLEDQYFAALILPAGSRGDAAVRPFPIAPPAVAGDTKKPKPDPQLIVSVGTQDQAAQVFVGPKKFILLREIGHNLDSVVWFSSYSLIAWLAKFLLLFLLWIHDHLLSNYGLAIILATVVLRLLLFPLNQYSMISMKKVQGQMQRIQPKVNQIKAKYRKNKDAESRQKMNEETMALYRKEGVNPMGGMSGCLPLLIQFPILIGFYNMLTVAVELRGAPFFGWIQDLTLKDPWYVTPLLMGATMFLQQKMTTNPGGDPAQRRVMLMMPIVFTVMFLNLPSGLVLYWFVNNLLGIGQQWLVNRHMGRLEAAAQKA